MEQVKLTNKDLYEKQLETLKIFFEKGILTKEQYEFELKVLDEKIKR